MRSVAPIAMVVRIAMRSRPSLAACKIVPRGTICKVTTYTLMATILVEYLSIPLIYLAVNLATFPTPYYRP